MKAATILNKYAKRRKFHTSSILSEVKRFANAALCLAKSQIYMQNSENGIFTLDSV